MKRLILLSIFSVIGVVGLFADDTICDTCEGELIRTKIEDASLRYRYNEPEYTELSKIVDYCTVTSRSFGLLGYHIFDFFDVQCIDVTPPPDDNSTTPPDGEPEDDNSTTPPDGESEDDNSTTPSDGEGEGEADEEDCADGYHYRSSTDLTCIIDCPEPPNFFEGFKYQGISSTVSECNQAIQDSGGTGTAVDIDYEGTDCPIYCYYNDSNSDSDSDNCGEHSSKSVFSSDCNCDYGYVKSDSDRCIKLECPPNSNPDIFDGSSCKCEYGYIKSSDGKECFEDNGCVKNAQIDLTTGECECKDGFEKSTSNHNLSCKKPSDSDEESEDSNSSIGNEDDEDYKKDTNSTTDGDDDTEDVEESDGDEESDDDDIGFGGLAEKVDSFGSDIKGSLMSSLTAIGSKSPTFSCSGGCSYIANLTPYGLGNIKFDFCFDVRDETKVLWLLILAFFNFKMYLFIIRDLLKKL